MMLLRLRSVRGIVHCKWQKTVPRENCANRETRLVATISMVSSSATSILLYTDTRHSITLVHRKNENISENTLNPFQDL